MMETGEAESFKYPIKREIFLGEGNEMPVLRRAL